MVAANTAGSSVDVLDHGCYQSLPARVVSSKRKNYFRVNKVSWVAGPTKIYLHENILQENLTTEVHRHNIQSHL